MTDERPPCPKCHAPYHLEGAERYWEARWRDEKVENERLRAALFKIQCEQLDRATDIGRSAHSLRKMAMATRDRIITIMVQSVPSSVDER